MSKVPLALQEALAQFQGAENALGKYQEEHAPVIDKYHELHTRLDEAESVVRRLYAKHASEVGKTFDRFICVRQRQVNIPLFLRLMRDRGLPGEAYVDAKPTVNLKLFDNAAKDGSIPSDIVEQVVSYKAPTIQARK
jgi:hypothetical protein